MHRLRIALVCGFSAAVALTPALSADVRTEEKGSSSSKACLVESSEFSAARRLARA